MVTPELHKAKFRDIHEWNAYSRAELKQFNHLVKPVTIIENYSKSTKEIISINVYFVREVKIW